VQRWRGISQHRAELRGIARNHAELHGIVRNRASSSSRHTRAFGNKTIRNPDRTNPELTESPVQLDAGRGRKEAVAILPAAHARLLQEAEAQRFERLDYVTNKACTSFILVMCEKYCIILSCVISRSFFVHHFSSSFAQKCLISLF
jgi:hypothetical protein